MRYDHRNESMTSVPRAAELAEVQPPATLPLTGKIVGYLETSAGVPVVFEVDERWGFGRLRLTIDLEALEL